MLSLGLGLGLKTKFFGLGLGLGLAVSGLGLGLAFSGLGLGLGLELCGLVNNATRPPGSQLIICTIRISDQLNNYLSRIISNLLP